jgi:hypothetical protein
MEEPRKLYPSQLDPVKKRQYYETFYAKQKEKGPTMCVICYGTYSYYNKPHHNKGLRHQRAVAEKKRAEDLKSAIQKLDKIFTEEDIKALPATSEAGSVAGD